MRVGDVLFDPRGKRVHVVYSVADADCATAPVPQSALAAWAETPDELREPRHVTLERHGPHETGLWTTVTDTIESWARQYVFADVNVTVMPRVE